LFILRKLIKIVATGSRFKAVLH